MVDNVISFTLNLKEFIVDEIALEGLEGIGIDLLWRRLEARTSSPFSEKMQEKWWNFIINCESISIYEQPVPVQRIEIVDRYSLVNEETGYLADPVSTYQTIKIAFSSPYFDQWIFSIFLFSYNFIISSKI